MVGGRPGCCLNGSTTTDYKGTTSWEQQCAFEGVPRSFSEFLFLEQNAIGGGKGVYVVSKHLWRGFLGFRHDTRSTFRWFSNGTAVYSMAMWCLS